VCILLIEFVCLKNEKPRGINFELSITNKYLKAMKTSKVTEKLDFRGQDFYIGLDVHKKNWSVCILSNALEHANFSQDPSPNVLIHHLEKNYPGANYFSAYEAGFCGFWIHQALTESGITNIVVNPSDIPTTDKEKKQKRDKLDSRKIAKGLRNKTLTGIYTPDEELLEDRLLIRTRQKLLSDIKRCKCRIKSQLNYFGVKIPIELDSPYWGKKFRTWLREKHFKYGSGNIIIQSILYELEYIELQKKNIEKEIINLASTKYKQVIERLRKITGVGLLGAITLAVEIGDITRFRTNDHLHSFCGLVPNVYASGDTEKVGRITKRHNAFIRPVLIQCAWRAAKSDPLMSQKYLELCKRMKGNKAIVRIAKKILNRVKYTWANNDYK